MNNNEKFYAEVKSLYAYLYEWKESLERNKGDYSLDDYNFMHDVLQSLRGQLKYFGKQTWERIEKDEAFKCETEEERIKRLKYIIDLKNNQNENLDYYKKVFNEYKKETNPDKKESLNRELGFLKDNIESTSYKLDNATTTKNTEKIKDYVRILNPDYTISFDIYKTKDNYITFKTEEELENERSIVLSEADSSFDRFDLGKKEGVIKLFNNLYDTYVSDIKLIQKLDNKNLVKTLKK